MLYVLNLLEELDPAAARQHWVRLLGSAAPEVRVSILERIERAPVPLDASPACVLAESDPSPDVQEAALRACLALDPSATAFVELYLDRERPELRRGALVGLLRYAGSDGVALAEQRLAALVSSGEAANRVLAAQVIGAAASDALRPHLALLLADQDAGVVRAALSAMGQAKFPALWPQVVDALANTRLRAAAAHALVAGAPASLEAIKQRLWLPETPRAVRTRLLKVCGRVRGPDVIALLADKLDWPDATARTHLLAGAERGRLSRDRSRRASGPSEGRSGSGGRGCPARSPGGAHAARGPGAC